MNIMLILTYPPTLKAMVEWFESSGTRQSMIEPITAMEVNKYGKIDITGEVLLQG